MLRLQELLGETDSEVRDAEEEEEWERVQVKGERIFKLTIYSKKLMFIFISLKIKKNSIAGRSLPVEDRR